MLRMLRKILFIPQPKITREQAISIARIECKEKGWTYRKPIAVEELRSWLVWTDSETVGGPFVVVDQQTGAVIRSNCPPR